MSAAAQPETVRVMAAMSMPRLAFTDNMFSAMQLVQMGFDVRKATGAFWEQSLSRLFYAAIEEGYDFVLTIDYDTMYLPVDVKHMLRMMYGTPEATAIFPVQYRREQDQILLGVEGSDGDASNEIFRNQLIPSELGHFGMTLFRMSKLKTLPHPWLWSQPNAEGRWDGAGGVDADVYFWRKLKEHDHKVFCASRIVIGHIQQMITWPGEDYQPVHQYLTAYADEGDAPRHVVDAAAKRAAKVA